MTDRCNPVSLLWLALLMTLVSCGEPEAGTEKPNILFIMVDDLGVGQLGVYNDTLQISDFDPFFTDLVERYQGYDPDTALFYTRYATPALDRIARAGMIFNRAYASSNLCAPSRLGIATGMMQNRFGVYHNVDCEVTGIPRGAHLAGVLHEAGYRTAHIGKWHIGTKNKELLREILLSNGLDEGTSPEELHNHDPEVYQEAVDAGYPGSVSPEHHPLNHGFDYYFGYNYWASQFYNSTLVWENFRHAGRQEGYNTDVFTDRALGFMKKQTAAGTPFYVQLHYHAVHDSLEPRAPGVYLNRFRSGFYDLDNFYAHLYAVDRNVQRIVDFLHSSELFENTIILFTSDNGAMAAGSYHGHKTGSPLPGNAPLSGHKGNYFQGGIRVPLFIHWPAGISDPGRSDQLVSTLDILPTFIDAAGVSVPDGLDGKSLLPLLHDRNCHPVHDYLVWAGVHSSAWGYLIMKTTKDHTTERPFAPGAWAVVKDNYLLRLTGSLEPGIYLEHMEGRRPVRELFHLGMDPAERTNVITKHPEIAREMMEIFTGYSDELPPPAQWDRNKWEEIRTWPDSGTNHAMQ